jgi:tRNA nucleotidyltransferase/poly(A) polymerase
MTAAGPPGLTGAQQDALAALVRSEPLATVLAALDGGGEEARLVGGAVRNALIGLPATDVDIAVTCLPEETMRRASSAGLKVVPTGIEHGTVTIVAGGRPFEATTLREDVETDGRRAKVRFGRDFARDAARRDFTINALSLDAAGRLHDTVGGLADLAAGRVRFIGEAQARIREDYLRILRFFRFHAAYGGGAPDKEGLAACIAGRDGLDGLSRERVRTELLKLVSAQGAVGTLRAMSAAGLWQRVTGGLCHTGRLDALSAACPDASPIERMAAAAVLTCADAARLRERLRLSNAEQATLTGIALACEALHGQGWPGASEARRLTHRHGWRALAVALACQNPGSTPAKLSSLEAAAQVPAFPLSGRDMVAAGLAPGPAVGAALARAETLWIERDFPMDPTALAAIVQQAARP